MKIGLPPKAAKNGICQVKKLVQTFHDKNVRLSANNFMATSDLKYTEVIENWATIPDMSCDSQAVSYNLFWFCMSLRRWYRWATSYGFEIFSKKSRFFGG